MLARFFVLRARLRAQPAPGIPCALVFLRDTDNASPGREIAPRECENVPLISVVIPGRREAASPESITTG
jgi:hypothetical protein